MKNIRASFWLWAMQVFPRWKAAAKRANAANRDMWRRIGG